MDSAKKEKIEDYIEKKEKAEQEWKLTDSTTTVEWIEKETKEGLNLFQRLRTFLSIMNTRLQLVRSVNIRHIRVSILIKIGIVRAVE